MRLITKLNTEFANENGFLDSESIFLLNKERTYNYILFFKLKGENVHFYDKSMFDMKNNGCCMAGRSKFDKAFL